jgi:tetratricopeptide (TPR) repeat protein
MSVMGISMVDAGDSGGIVVLEQSLAIALEHNLPEATRAYGNLAEVVSNYGGDLPRAAELREEGMRLAQRFGLADDIGWFLGERVVAYYWAGRWDEALAQADEMFSEAEAGSPNYMDAQAREVAARIALARGAPDPRLVASKALDLARQMTDPQVLYPALAVAARAEVYTGHPDEGAELVDELLDRWRDRPETLLHSHLQSFSDLAPALGLLGRGTELEPLAAESKVKTRWMEAAAAFLRGDFELAADVYAAAGSFPDEAFARLRAAEALIAEGDRTEGDRELQRALAFYRSVDAKAYLREGEALLARTA